MLAAVIFVACGFDRDKSAKIIFDRVPFVYATINCPKELFLIDTWTFTSRLDKNCATR